MRRRMEIRGKAKPSDPSDSEETAGPSGSNPVAVDEGSNEVFEETPGPSEPSKSLSTEESTLSPMEQLKIREKSSQESTESPSLEETPILTPSGSRAVATGSTSKDPDSEYLEGLAESSKSLIAGIQEAALKNIYCPSNQFKSGTFSQKTTEKQFSRDKKADPIFQDTFRNALVKKTTTLQTETPILKSPGSKTVTAEEGSDSTETPGPSEPSTSSRDDMQAFLSKRYSRFPLSSQEVGKRDQLEAQRQKALNRKMKDVENTCDFLNAPLETFGETLTNRWNASFPFRQTLLTNHNNLEVDDGEAPRDITARDKKTGNNLCVTRQIDGKDKVVLELTGSFYSAAELDNRTIGGDKTFYAYTIEIGNKKKNQLPVLVCINVKDKEKFLRRSCTPNAVVKLVKGERGMRWLVKTTKQLNNGAEILVAFDGDWKESKIELKCATHKGRMGECKMEQSRLNHHRNRVVPEQ